MSRPLAGTTAGLLAGAAGATALNITTLLHQAIYAQPPRTSDTAGAAARTVDTLADAAPVSVPGDATKRGIRIAALGPLAGIGVGLAVGAGSGALRGFSVKVPRPVAALVIGLVAMAVSDGTAIATGATHPREWTPMSVAADLLPHLAYGAATTFTLHRLLDPATPTVG